MGNSWFDEISFDPAAPLLQMGTRKLGDGSWLIADDDHEADLALKSELLSQRYEEVFQASEDSLVASRALLVMIQTELTSTDQTSTDCADNSLTGLHPLEEAARLVQEDLCLMHLRDGTWHLDAACLCFPSRWRLADKISRPLVEVHGPVKNYDPVLVGRVNGVFDRLLNRPEDRPVWRRNWFIHPNPDRFQPSVPDGGDPVVPLAKVLSHLWVRSERQVLRKVLDPDWAVFSIRIQQASLGELFSDEDNGASRAERLAGYLKGSSAATAAHHGIGAQQRKVLLDALG